jgi:hypothetical protein
MAVATLPNFLFTAQPTQNANDRIIAKFIAYLRTEKGLAQNTIEAYRSDLAQLLTFLGRTADYESGNRRPQKPCGPTAHPGVSPFCRS